MYIEFKPGEKHAAKNAETADTPDSFQDCGYAIERGEVIIDIDHLPKDSIKAMITMFNIRTQVVWTDRGAHLYFKKPVGFSKARDGVCRLGFEIEQHTDRTRPNGITIKRNGVLRTIENEGLRQVMPDIFTVAPKKKPFEDLTKYGEDEGRNNALFKHRCALNNCNRWETILQFINQYVFTDPLPEDEMETICRSLEIGQKTDDKFWIASEIISSCRTVVYLHSIWWFSEGEYITDEDDIRLLQKIYSMCEGQETRVVKEILGQIEIRSPRIPNDTAFPIRFRNGVLQDGAFIQMDNYVGFTPYFIDIVYDPEAAPEEVVDTYINNLTDNDPEYRKLLMEVIGYALITDPERIRSLGKFFMFRGDGANGKGTLLQIMKRIYNAKNCTNLSIKQLTDDRYQVTMVGKLANLGDDIEPKAIDNDQLKVIKNISTADTVSTRKLYSQSVSVTYTTKLYFTTNSDIKSFEKGYAYKRRVMWLPMFNTVDKPDPYFISKITTQPALKYWVRLIVEGYLRLYTTRSWTSCKRVEDYNDAYHENNNPMLQFVRDMGEDGFIGKTPKEIRQMYDEWQSDEASFSAKMFREALWSIFKIGLGAAKVGGATKRVYLRQADTSQQLAH